MPLFFYSDWTYLLLVLPAVILALFAQINVSSTFNKYSKIFSNRGFTGHNAARAILDANGLYNVSIVQTPGKLTDHYDPRNNIIKLSDSVHDSRSVAAIGVAAHEAGHALQYAKGYVPMKFRAAIIPVTNVGSTLAFPLVLLGIVLSAPTVAYLGVILFGFVTLFQIITLPVEFNASRRALQALTNSSTLNDEEIRGSKKVLTAAALTYVAALAVSIGNFLRLLIISGRSRRR